MKNLLFNLFIAFGAMLFTAVTLPAFAGGAAGSWGDDSGYSGNGGFGGAGSGGSWSGGQCTGYSNGVPYKGSLGSVATQIARAIENSYGNSFPVSVGTQTRIDDYNFKYTFTANFQSSPWTSNINCGTPPEPPKQCPSGSVLVGNDCVQSLTCPSGYVKSGDKCIWQCPAGTKMVGGNCVKDDQPEDCDPMTQQCDENGAPVCDPCSKLQQLVNNNLTMINNDNRIISLTENISTTLNTTNNNINNVNNTINNVNNTLNTINESISNVITTIENNKPEFDTTGIESKLDAVITAIQDNNGVGDDGQPIDLTEIIRLLNAIDTGVKENKFDDTQLNAYFDEIINKGIPVGVDFTPVTERQDEQTGLLEDIRRLLMPTNEAELAPSLEDTSFDAHLDPWSAIRGFDVNQNMINAQAQCPSGDAYSFTFLGKTFAMPMQILCGYLGQIGVGIMFLAYISGAFIIVKGD